VGRVPAGLELQKEKFHGGELLGVGQDLETARYSCLSGGLFLRGPLE